MNLLAPENRKPILDLTLALSATVVIAFLVINDGLIPRVFTTAFFAPIIFLAYRHPLPYSLTVAVIASAATSPAMGVFGAQMNESVMPVFWLGWPAVYLFRRHPEPVGEHQDTARRAR